MYDYGIQGNLNHYNSTKPPQYSLSVIPKSLPISLFYGNKDILADEKDVLLLISELPTKPIFIKKVENYAHLDFSMFFIIIIIIKYYYLFYFLFY